MAEAANRAAPVVVAALTAASSKIEAIDRVRRLYARVIELLQAKEALLEEHAQMLLQPRNPCTIFVDVHDKTHEKNMPAGSAKECVVEELLNQDNWHWAPLSLPDLADGGTSMEQKNLLSTYQRLAQLDETIAAIETLCNARNLAAASKQSPRSLEAQGDSGYLLERLKPFMDLCSADADLSNEYSALLELHAGAPARQVSTPPRESSGDAVRLSGLPATETLFRPFMSSRALKRLRLTSGGAVALPCGASSAEVAAALQPGDVLHVPFSKAEAAALQMIVGAAVPLKHAQGDGGGGSRGGDCVSMGTASGVCVSQVNEAASPAHHVFETAAAWLPGRSALDCERYWREIQPAPSDEQKLKQQAHAAEQNHMDAPPQTAAHAARAPIGVGAMAHARTPLPRPTVHAPVFFRGAEEAPDAPNWRETSLAPPSRARPRQSGALHAAAHPAAHAAAHAHRRRTDHLGLASLVGSRSTGCFRHALPPPCAYRQWLWSCLHARFKPTSVSTRPTGNVVDIAFSPPSAHALRLAVGSTAEPYEALLYDLVSSRCATLGGRAQGHAHGATVTAVRFSACGARLLTAGYDATVRVWGTDTGSLQHVLGTARRPPAPTQQGTEVGGGGGGGEGGGVTGADAGALAAAAGEAGTTDALTSVDSSGEHAPNAGEGATQGVGVALDGPHRGAGSSAHGGNVTNGAAPAGASGHAAGSSSQTGQAGSSGLDGWQGGLQGAALGAGVQAAPAAPIATATGAATETATNGAAEAEHPSQVLYSGSLAGHSDHVLCLCVHPHRDELAASGGKDQVVVLWDAARAEALHRLECGRDPCDLAFGKQQSSGLLFAALDSVAHGRGEGSLDAWSIETGQQLLHKAWPGVKHVSCLSVSESGEHVLAGAADGGIRRYCAKSGLEVATISTSMRDVNVLSLSADEMYLQAAGDAELAYIFDMRKASAPLHQLQHDAPHASDYVNGVSAQWCHHARTTLVTGSDDGLVRIWDVASGEPLLAKLQGHSAPISCVAVSPDDDMIVSGGDEGKLVLYSRASTLGSYYSIGLEQDNFLRASS